MKLLVELAKYPVFDIEKVKKYVGNEKTAYSQLLRWMKKDLVRKVRRNLYSVVNISTGELVANNYQIACAISSTAYLSHHSAFEYYGLGNQVFNEIYVSSKTKFEHFDYNHFTYKYIASKMDEGVIEARNTTGIRLTDLERTVVDSVKDVNKISGFEELLNCLDGIQYLDEIKLKKYLDIYNIQSLYQRLGYVLDKYQDVFHISDKFLNYCRNKVGKTRSYLVSQQRENNMFNRDWNLMVPVDLFNLEVERGNHFV